MNRRPPTPTGATLTKDEARKQRRAALIPVAIGLLIVAAFATYVSFDNSVTQTVFPFSTGDLSLNAPPHDALADGHDPFADDLAWEGLPPKAISQMFFQKLLSQSDLAPDTDLPPAPDAGPAVGPASSLGAMSLTDQLLSQRPADRSLGIEPADLPPPKHGVRIGGFARSEGHVTDEMAFWKVNATHMHEIIDTLSLAAGEVNFTPVQRTGPRQRRPSHIVTRIFTRDSRLPHVDGQPAQDHPDAKLPTANDVLVLRARPTADGQIHLTVWYRHATTPSQMMRR